jgi:hypothetical protein
MTQPEIGTSRNSGTSRISSLHHPLLRKPGGDAGLLPLEYSSGGGAIQLSKDLSVEPFFGLFPGPISGWTGGWIARGTKKKFA